MRNATRLVPSMDAIPAASIRYGQTVRHLRGGSAVRCLDAAEQDLYNDSQRSTWRTGEAAA